MRHLHPRKTIIPTFEARSFPARGTGHIHHCFAGPWTLLSEALVIGAFPMRNVAGVCNYGISFAEMDTRRWLASTPVAFAVRKELSVYASERARPPVEFRSFVDYPLPTLFCRRSEQNMMSSAPRRVCLCRPYSKKDRVLCRASLCHCSVDSTLMSSFAARVRGHARLTCLFVEP